MKRHEPSLQPSAPLLAANARAKVLDDAALQHELVLVLSDRIEDSRDIHVWILGSVVILQGRVSSELDRLLAEDLVYTRPGVRKCHNRLVVASPSAMAVA